MCRKNDPWGVAIQDYYNGRQSCDITVLSPDFDDDTIPLAHLFRDYSHMPPIEQQALKLCRGRVLDIGSGAGSHALYLQENQFEVLSLDCSRLAIETQKKRGIKQTICCDIHQFNLKQFNLSNKPFETLLLLMNGIGIAGKLSQLEHFLTAARSWVIPGGQCLLDSSDVAYLYEDDISIAESPKNSTIENDPSYYREISYQFAYKDIVGRPFTWLFVDFPRLHRAAEATGWRCEKVYDGDHFDYLARLTKR